MGQSRDKFQLNTGTGGASVLKPTSVTAVDAYDKDPGERAAGQANPRVVDDLVSNLISERQPMEMEGAGDLRMAGDILDSESLKSMAHESSRTKYGPGQLSKSPGVSSYLGQASYPAS